MMLGLGVSAEEANAPIQVFIRDRQAHNAAIKIPHFHQIVAKKSYVAQPGNLRHSVLPCLYGVQGEEQFLAWLMLSAKGFNYIDLRARTGFVSLPESEDSLLPLPWSKDRPFPSPFSSALFLG